MRHHRSFHRHAVALAVLIALAGAVQAQVATSTLQGQVTSNNAAAPAGMAVTAVNKDNGNTYRTTTRSDGSYVLPGLAPGSYEIRITGPSGEQKTETVTLHVGETASVDLSVGAQTITIVGSAARRDVKGSQIDTLVSRRMIEALPQQTHNFLSAADLAPGVAFTQTSEGDTRIQSGAQNFDHVNVFIDGVGQKNNILRGGLTGQDTSRGNPFPQSAIAEYRVLTQNYKAEFEQVSSAAISAITKSGSNEFHGDAYVDRTGTNWRARSVFEKQAEAQGRPLLPSDKYEYGFSVGGPIKVDQTHFFFAYDGKEIGDSRQPGIPADSLVLLPQGQGIVPALMARQGSQVDKFHEDLLFGKLDTELTEEQHLSLSAKVRRETDRRPEDRNLSAPGNDKNRSNDETRVDLKHEWTHGPWLSEARIGYENAVWNPHSASGEPFVKYKVGNDATNQQLTNSRDVLWVGGSPDAQYRAQKGTYVAEDLTYTGLLGHVFKAGVKLQAMRYNLSGTAFSVDTVETLIDRVTGQPYYDNGACTGTNLSNGNTDQCKITPALPGASANFNNRQLGLFMQDDWSLTKQLELNLGVRWDYESNMLNNHYVTPADRVTALFSPEPVDANGFSTRGWPVIPGTDFPVAPGQTYDQSLAKGGINIRDYISTGDSRKAYKGAIAPRLGASYDVFGDRNTVVYGGWGRSYDRTMANHALDELQKNQQANGEIWLIRNNVKVPFADQFSLGLRQALGEWNGELAFSSVHAKRQFVWFSGNRDPLGGWAHQSPIDPLWNGPPGFGSLILGDTVGETKTDSIFVKAEKPYTAASGWSAQIAYTYSDAKTTSREWNNDIFDWTYGRSTHGWNPSTLVAKHRVVAAGVFDRLLPWGLTTSFKLTWDSGLPRRLIDCHLGFDQCVAVEGNAPSFRQVDASVAKEFTLLGQKFRLRADVLNLFNTTNYGGFDDWVGGPGNPQNALGGDNANLGKPNSIRGDTRTVRLVLGYSF
jgi:outer membrane receptor protein involved in Fe transport